VDALQQQIEHDRYGHVICQMEQLSRSRETEQCFLAEDVLRRLGWVARIDKSPADEK
jgi:hypothetical protein